jgi:hypothetical protein
MRTITGALWAFIILAALASVSLAASDLFTGTWDLDRDASKGGARSQVLTFDVTATRESYRSELLLSDGTRQVTHYRAEYDGKEYPSETTITKPDKTETVRRDTVILTRIGPASEERRWKQGGRVVRILRRQVSSDGNTLLSTVVDVDESGHEHITGKLVFRRRF